MARLTVLYDGSCSLCRASVARVRPFDTRHRIDFLNLHVPSTQERFPQIDREAALRWMQAVNERGRIYSGVDAWTRIGLVLPWWNLVAWTLLVPGVHWMATRIYLWIARNRYRWNRELCADGSCSVHIPAVPSSKR